MSGSVSGSLHRRCLVLSVRCAASCSSRSRRLTAWLCKSASMRSEPSSSRPTMRAGAPALELGRFTARRGTVQLDSLKGRPAGFAVPRSSHDIIAKQRVCPLCANRHSIPCGSLAHQPNHNHRQNMPNTNAQSSPLRRNNLSLRGAGTTFARLLPVERPCSFLLAYFTRLNEAYAFAPVVGVGFTGLVFIARKSGDGSHLLRAIVTSK